MPTVDGQPYLASLLTVADKQPGDRTIADYFESVTTGESSHVPVDTGSIKDFTDEFFRQFSLKPFTAIEPNCTPHADIEILDRVFSLLAESKLGKSRLAYAKPLSQESVLRTVYAYTLQLKRHGTVFLCSLPADGVDTKNCKLGLLMRSPSLLSTVTILRALVIQGYVSVQYEEYP